MRGCCISVEFGYFFFLMVIGELDEMVKVFCVFLSKIGVYSGIMDRSGFFFLILIE